MTMAASLRRPVDPLRVAAGLFAIFVVGAGLVALEATFPAGPWGWAAGVATGLVLVPLLASPVEWFVHRYTFHRPTVPAIYDIHHRSHHHVFFPTWRYVTGGPPRRVPLVGSKSRRDEGAVTARENAAIHLAHFAFYATLGVTLLCVPVWMLTGRPPLLAGMAVSLVVVAELMVLVHDSIHRPGIHPYLERRAWFRRLDRHHYIHHVDTEANVNFLLPLADGLFGTLRTTLTEKELARHGSWERARERPAGEGEPAHRSRASGSAA
jgi:sterol desaturase/sphingolipid hydroxylase (fatty acid hydroxylase superfamily)